MKGKEGREKEREKEKEMRKRKWRSALGYPGTLRSPESLNAYVDTGPTLWEMIGNER